MLCKGSKSSVLKDSQSMHLTEQLMRSCQPREASVQKLYRFD